MKIWCIIPAAGLGKRMGGTTPKQYLQLASKTVLEHALDVIFSIEAVESLVLVLSDGDNWWPDSCYASDQRIIITTGGKERADSVLNGLKAVASLAGHDDWALVHDAARPCVRKEDIQKLIEQCINRQTGGILAIPVRDTMKIAKDQFIISTVSRENLWHALTPQFFPFHELVKAIESALRLKVQITDEASAMEYARHSCLVVESDICNIKITHPQDLELAAYYLFGRN